MPAEGRLVTAGRVGRAHGLDGSFRVTDPKHPLDQGTTVTLDGVARAVDRRSGTTDRPLVRLEGIEDRESAAALSGEPLLVVDTAPPPEDGEWLVDDLVGLQVPGVGRVVGVLPGVSCDVLEVDDGTLVPLISDAVTRVDVEAGTVEVDRAFLGLGR